MKDRNILFSVFDRKKGSVPIYYTGLSEQEAVHITRRSEMTLSMMTSSELETAEAILPFSALKKLGFILLFQVQQSNPEEPTCVAALSYIVPQDQQVFLYNKVPFLKFKAEELATQIKQNYVYSGAFPKTLVNVLNSWRVTEKETTMEIEIVERKVTLSEKKEGGSIDFFLSQIKKNEDRALGALYRGIPVFVTGKSNVLVDLIVHSLDMFAPHLTSRKVSYTSTLVDPSYADIIGISKDLAKNYPKETLIDIDKKQVRQGTPCRFSKAVIKKIRKNPDSASDIVRTHTERLLEVASLLIDVYSDSEEVRASKIDQIQKKFDPDLIEVAAEIGAQRNPLIRELLLQAVSSRFMDWMEGL